MLNMDFKYDVGDKCYVVANSDEPNLKPVSVFIESIHFNRSDKYSHSILYNVVMNDSGKKWCYLEKDLFATKNLVIEEIRNILTKRYNDAMEELNEAIANLK